MTNDNKDLTSSEMSQKILKLIEQKGIHPKPRWHFLVREWVVWGMALLTLLVGSLATALTLYIGNTSRFMEQQILFSDILFLFRLIPFLWLFLLSIAIFYTVYAVRETRRGYKWSSSWLIAGAIGVSMFVGSSVYATGFGESIDRYLLTEMPLYKPLTNYHPKMWMNTEKGVLAGTVTEVKQESFVIQKIDGERLTVTLVSEDDFTRRLHEGMRVRLLGTTTIENGEEVFQCSTVEPFRGRGGMVTKQARMTPPLQMKENYGSVRSRQVRP